VSLLHRVDIGDYPDSGKSRIFSFDVASPLTYAAAPGVEPEHGEVVCCPMLDPRGDQVWAGREEVERVAAAAGLPLAWPERRPDGRAANRVAIHARDRGRGLAFALAAGRLAFGGGFDLDATGVLAQAASAAGLDADEALAAAGDERYDLELRATARRAAERGLVVPALEAAGARAAAILRA
jgi:2-hydroxychromene-2-carboxylate isomerase